MQQLQAELGSEYEVVGVTRQLALDASKGTL